MSQTQSNTSPDIGAGQKCEVDTTAGAIAITRGTVILNAAGVLAMTLALPVAGQDDGKELLVVDITGHAHTVTTPANGLNGSDHIATFGATKGQVLGLVAYNGGWWANPSATGITLS